MSNKKLNEAFEMYTSEDAKDILQITIYDPDRTNKLKFNKRDSLRYSKKAEEMYFENRITERINAGEYSQFQS